MYVDALFDRKKDKILVAERVNGKREYNEIDVEYTFYYEHPSGSHKSIYGDSCKKFTTTNGNKFRKEVARIKSQSSNKKPPKTFETDVNHLFMNLNKHYKGVDAPELNVGFFDIEVNFHEEHGFAPPHDPFNSVNAISLYITSMKKLISLVLCPPTLSLSEAQKICDEFEDTYLFDDEVELLKTFLDLIEDVDVLSGWNSKGFDIPYLVNRIIRVMTKDQTKRFCLWDRLPFEIEYKKYKKVLKSYDLVGRVHLDYLDLYQKHNPQKLHSYRLDFVGEIEVGENKVPYEGTLDELYKNDFKKFIEYNRQDTLLLAKIDKKKKFIELANQVAHSNGVLLKTTMGSVALVEQAIINEMHEMGFVVPDKKEEIEEEDIEDFQYDEDDDEDAVWYQTFRNSDDETLPVVGAYVAKPKTGIHDQIGCVDINSLYPSAIRALNMSPETIVGHIVPSETTEYIRAKLKTLTKTNRAESWDGVFHTFEYGHIMSKDGAPITIDFEDGTSKTMSGRQWYDYIFNPKNNLCITANGTLFKTDKDGTIPLLLAKWYAQRKEMQAREGAYAYALDKSTNFAKTLEISDAKDFINKLKISFDNAKQTHIKGKSNLDVGLLIKLIKKEEFDKIAEIMVEYDFIIDGDRLSALDNNVAKFWQDHWNQRQQARKILLNSLYGALLNKGLRFYDERLGQSVTLTGRCIVRHMNAKINEIITGDFYDYQGESIIYSDTDSSYFSAYNFLKDTDFDMSKESFIALYDAIADEVNLSFPEFMKKTFNTSLDRGGYIKAGRELVASKGLFIKKKKYAVLMYDKEGKRLDIDKDGKPSVGKLKVMGLDIKRSDTPKYMQTFLENLLLKALTDVPTSILYEEIKQFRKDFTNKDGWDKGTPKAINGLSDYISRIANANKVNVKDRRSKDDKVRIPGHVQASINWNKLCDIHDDKYSMRITDGSKIIVVKLLSNITGMTSVAYPIDEPHLPTWFKSLPFDHNSMEEVIIDKKLNNLFGVLNWDLEQTKERSAEEFFTWG